MREGSRSRGGSRRGRPDPSRRSRRGRAENRFGDLEEWGGEDEPAAEERPSRRGAAGRRRRGRPARGGRSRDDAFDWSAADGEGEEPERDEGGYDDEAAGAQRGRRGKKPPPKRRLSLMDLCTPVFGFAAVLPRSAEDAQPGYPQYRSEVLQALQRVENEASEHRIELEDARQAVYALCFFLDSQVASSAWSAKSQWASEPLGIVLQQDAEGGVNFFRRLDALGDRQKAVREVYLVCLALGFRGKYAELEPTQQAAKIGEIRQKLVRSIHPTPMEKLPELFPEGYAPADPIEDEVPPPPRWWVWASLGSVAVALLIWILLFFGAGKVSESELAPVRELARPSADASLDAAPAPPPRGGPRESLA